MADYAAAIDQGTTSTRFMIFDHAGQVVAVDQKEHEQIFPKPGWVEHDPMEIIERTHEVVAGALKKAGISGSDLAAVGVTNQRETTVVWERSSGKPIHNALVWQDTRTDQICNELSADGGQDRFRAATGLPIATYFSGPKIRWILDNVEGARARAEAGDLLFGNIDTWVIWNITGGPDGGAHVTDVTNASRTMLMDLQTLDWDDGILDAIGVPRAVLPEIRSSSQTYGDATGDLAGIPVAGDLGDQQAALFGQTCFAVGEAKNTYGTGNFLLLNTGTKAVPSKSGLITGLGYKIGDQPAAYMLEGSIAITGALVQWLRDNIGLISSSGEVEDLAKTVEDNGGVYFVPAFSGLFAPYWRSDARGVIAGLTRYVNKGHIARAVLEATAWQTKEVVEAMNADSGVALTSLKVDGGMVYNETLMQFQADVLQVPVIRPTVAETTSLGAAYAAGLAVGFWKEVEDLRANWGKDKEWQPRMDPFEVEREYSHWKKATARTFDWVDGDWSPGPGPGGAEPIPEGGARVAPPAQRPTQHGERRINIWVGDDPDAAPIPLALDTPSHLSFAVGGPVAASVAVGPGTVVPDTDIPAAGLETSWVVWSSDLALQPSSPEARVEEVKQDRTRVWTATFDLHIPALGESNAVRLIAKAINPGVAHLHALIYVGPELYRQLTVLIAVRSAEASEAALSTPVTIEADEPRTRAAHLSVGTTHEWTTPPGHLSFTIVGDQVFLGGTSMGPVGPTSARAPTTENGQREPWVGVASRVSGPIENLLADAERLRAIHESYLNDVNPDDLLSRLANPVHQYNWDAFQYSADPTHELAWQTVSTSDELWSLAKSGRALTDTFFPKGSRLRNVFEFLSPGHRIDIDWTPQGNYVPHVPWGLLYLGEVPARGQPIDPTGFLGLRFRIGYTSHLIPGGSAKSLGRLESTFGTHLIYQGMASGAVPDAVAEEAAWQRNLLSSWSNQVLVPSGAGDPLTELRQLVADPAPTPVAVVYLYCQSGGQATDPLLRFGPTAHPYDLTRHDLGDRQIQGEPLVFANACTTATADPYFAGLLEETFFQRGCRGYLGTETKVPITLASRFALIFFEYFYRRVAPEPISAGEAVTQARLSLWTNYRNIGGLFYSFVNNYELFLADDDEVRALRV